MLRAFPLLLSLAAADPYVTIPFPTPSAPSLSLTMGYGTVNSTGTRFTWSAATLDDLSRFSVALPSGGCNVRATTTSTAVALGCAVAANSGYFQFSKNPTFCTGSLVVNGSIVLWTDGLPLIATTRNATLLGVLTRADVAALGVVSAVSGSGIIVLGGAPSAAGAADARAYIKALRPTAEEIAPRTIAALDAAGRMYIVAIDGVERLNLGVTMTEAAEVFSGGASGFPFATTHAINLDGGGSTTLSASPLLNAALAPAQVYNRPTDTDFGPISERQVTSIFCVK
jgi:hypothetical protein